METAPETAINTSSAVERILSGIEREREREIIARRFGLHERKWKRLSRSVTC